MISGLVVLVVLGLVAVFLVGLYNGLVRARNEVKNAWSQIDVQLQRRHDLIPNLVETVKGYAKQERELFERIAEARTKYFQQTSVAGKIEASNRLEGALSRLLLLQEQYPQLKANASFLKLQDSLEGTENRIGLTIYPKTHYVTPRDAMLRAVDDVRAELRERLAVLREAGKLVEAQRLESRTLFDLEMIVELGYCTGIENYSRYLSGRRPGEPPPCLFDSWRTTRC